MFEGLLDKFSATMTIQFFENRLKILDNKGSVLYDDVPILALKTNAKGDEEVFDVGNSVSSLHNNNIEIYRPYANPRIIIDDFEKAAIILRFAIEKSHMGKGFFSPKVTIQVLRKFDTPLTQVEKQILQELAENVGAREVIFKD